MKLYKKLKTPIRPIVTILRKSRSILSILTNKRGK